MRGVGLHAPYVPIRANLTHPENRSLTPIPSNMMIFVPFAFCIQPALLGFVLTQTSARA